MHYAWIWAVLSDVKQISGTVNEARRAIVDVWHTAWVTQCDWQSVQARTVLRGMRRRNLQPIYRVVIFFTAYTYNVVRRDMSALAAGPSVRR